MTRAFRINSISHLPKMFKAALPGWKFPRGIFKCCELGELGVSLPYNLQKTNVKIFLASAGFQASPTFHLKFSLLTSLGF